MTDYGTLAFWILAGLAFLAWVSVAIKLFWWESYIGRWFFVFTGTFVFETSFIVALQNDWVPNWAREQYRFIIYGALAMVLLWLIIDIWRKNWNNWAWKYKDYKDAS